MLQRALSLTLVLALCITMSGCLFKAFHPTIQQGNIITDSKANAIHNGMSIQAVTDILGSPILQNIYPNGQIAYVYTLQVRGGKIHKRYLVIRFQGGRVVGKQADSDWPNLPDPVA